MTSFKRSHGARVLLCGVSVFSLGVLAHAQAESTAVETVTVTGSRLINSAVESPTPVTQLSADQLQMAAPSNIPDALNKMPQFVASTNQQSFGSLKRSNNANYMNLRSFGIIRNLILLDGRRVTSTSKEGLVDTNILPQLLISRVDVVTGGASAVYGADAVTGVVNFVLDKRFEGLKVEAQGGISTFGDAKSYKFGIAGGTRLFSGRGHVEGSYLHYDATGIPDSFDRDNGRSLYTVTGTGTAANPFKLTKNVRDASAAFNPLIWSGPLADNIFTGANTVTPFQHGVPTGSGNLEVGGDGTYIENRPIITPLTQDQVFGRISYDVTSNVQAFVQANFSQSTVKSSFYAPGSFTSARNGVYTVSVNNPYLSPSIASIYTGAGLSTFGIKGRLNKDYIRNETTNTNVMVTAGLEGDIYNRFHWQLYYTHGRNWERNELPNNVNYQRVAAALDTINSGSSVVCRATAQFPDCVPLNPFVPTSMQDPAAVAWVTQATHWSVGNRMDDIGGTIDGEIYQLPAGPLKVALTAEWRSLGETVNSNAPPALTVDCTGITVGCSSANYVWTGGNVPESSGSEEVYEFATELNVPIVKNVFLIEALSLNLAGRYAHYSPGFSANTWKIGAEWQVTDDLRFRSTFSRDIRAPSLDELYTPVANSLAGFTDIHTGTTDVAKLISGGNPNLRPEIGDTKTVGLVYKPQWLPGLSLMVDYYNIKLRNAISNYQGQAVATQQLCEASNGTSPVCDLYERPLPWSDRTPANFPTVVYTHLINASKAWTSGWDTEIEYVTDVGETGMLNTRLMVAYQPVNSSQLPGEPIFNYAGTVPQGNPTTTLGGAKWRVTFNLAYSDGPWTFNVMERWRDHLQRSVNSALVFEEGRLSQMDYTDVSVSYELGDWLSKQVGYQAESGVLFLNVQNVFNKQPPLYVDTLFANAVGGLYPAAPGDSPMGRYFTLGFRTRF